MTRRARSDSRARTDPTEETRRAEQLAILGLATGDRVRWHAGPSGRWRYGTVKGRERDGSIAVAADGGAARSFDLERLEVRTRGPRGAQVWEAVTVRAARAEQLSLGFA